MATSIRDLAYRLQAEASLLMGAQHDSTSVRPALNRIGRTLHHLIAAGLDEVDWHVRDIVTDELANAALTLEPAVDLNADPPADNRVTDLAVALGEAVTLRLPHTGYEQRWAAAVLLANTCRALTSYAGDEHPPRDLDWVRRTTRAVAARALTDPPLPVAGQVLDVPIPTTTLPANASPARAADNALATLVLRLDGARTGQHRLPTLVEAFAVTRAAESTLRYAAAITAILSGHTVPAVHPAPAAWHAIRSQLQPYATVPPARLTDNDLSVWARDTHLGLRAAFGSLEQLREQRTLPPARLYRHLQRMASHTPLLADALATALPRIADAGDLHALAHRLPHREDRTSEYVTHRPVVADRHDLDAAMRALDIAAGHSAEAALALHIAGGGSNEPGLIAAHTDRARTATHHTLPAPIRWQPLAAAIDTRISADPHWPALAAQMQRIHIAGGDVPGLLTQAIATPLPERHPARSLDYRLNDAHPNPARPRPVAPDAATATPVCRPEPPMSRPVPPRPR